MPGVSQMTGLVIKGIGGFYFVESEGKVFRARGRGSIKGNDVKLTIGDTVLFEPPKNEGDDGVITEVCPRKNIFERPAVSNVDVVFVTVSVKKPAADLFITDKLLAMAEKNDTEPVVVINKIDADPEEGRRLLSIYEKIYPTFAVSGKTGENTDRLKEAVGTSKAVFAGPSGVGKSTLTNRISPDAAAETGSVSRKTSRGRNTTRHVEIFHAGSGYIFDTPGFTSFDLRGIDERELGGLFRDIAEYSAGCEYGDCLHDKEPNCAVREAAERGDIAESRFRSYQMCLEEIRRKK
jgi:ribosome biogenesis GTPase